MKFLLIYFLFLSICLPVLVYSEKKNSDFVIEAQDRDFLQEILLETWQYLDDTIVKETGYPSDTQELSGTTNTTNIGLYLASLCVAERLGLCDRLHAISRSSKILSSLKKYKSKRGFLPNWLNVTPDFRIPDGVFAVSDFNKLISGLIMFRQSFPILAQPASELIEKVDWNWLYDKKSGQTYWGYDLINDKAVGKGFFWFSADTRMAVFYMIASQAVPVDYWQKQRKKKFFSNELDFFEPGYEFGALFMQAMGGIFIDERASEAGKSVGNLSWDQIKKAKIMKMPVWGWSNCNIPGSGYTEGGFIPWNVITPHASALVIEYYPRHVIANLKRLSELGMRKPQLIGKMEKKWGFRDSIDLISGKIDERYLCLDQAMLFLSLSNFLHNGIVREIFGKDEFVNKGKKILSIKQNPKQLELWKKRDKAGVTAQFKDISEQKLPFEIDFQQKNLLKISARALKNGSLVKKNDENFKFEHKINSQGLQIDFSFPDDNSVEAELKIEFPSINGFELDKICFEIELQNILPKQDFGWLRLRISDKQGQNQYAHIQLQNGSNRQYCLQNNEIKGILADPRTLNAISIRFWQKPWFYTTKSCKLQKLLS